MEATTKYKSKQLFMVVLHGPMGSGKTALADIIHDEIADTAHFGADHIKWLVSKNVPSHTQVAKNMIPLMAEGYLKQVINTILEQAFSEAEIKELENTAKRFNAQFLVYQLDAGREVLSSRIVERTQRLGKLEVSKEHIDKSYEEYLANIYSGGIVFDSVKMSLREMADKILRDLGLI